MNSKNPKVDFYFDKSTNWHAALEQLRNIALDCGLTEELKWGVPCYTLGKRNVLLIHVFKEYCAYLFFKGVLLQDAQGLLIQQTEQVQSGRQIRFTQVQEIIGLAPVLKSYIYEAIEVEKAGHKVPFKKSAEYPVPEEFQEQLSSLPGLKPAFEALTAGRQRAYLLHFSGAKLSATRATRVAKCIPDILNGKGLNDAAVR